MKPIKIEWLNDESDCDTCGPSWSMGARVTVDNEVILELIPFAHCLGGDHWDEDDIYRLIFEKLGYKLI